jgi:hypothetical protein
VISSRQISLPSTSPVSRLGILIAATAAALLAATPAWAQDGAPVAKIDRLNKQALDAFDGLNFDQAKTLLEQALAEADSAGLTADESVARTHLNLGMLLIAGFQQKEQAIDHFKAALKAKRDIAAPSGLFNPEVQEVFDEVKANMETEPEPPAPVARPRPKPVTTATAAAEGEGEEQEDDGEGEAKMLLSVGLGSGFGYAKSHLDANKDGVEVNGMLDNSWSGAGPSRLGHVVASAGYYLSRQLVLSLEGRLQIISGTTPTATTAHCMPSCKPPGTAFAGLVKASWFFSSDKLSPFVSGGVGAGKIRHVVKPKGLDDCGTGAEQCVDTVTGGPLLLAAGGGIAYQLGKLTLLGSVTTNLAVPNFMLNVDLVLGLGLRL